jgi:hypothetical protein
MKKFLKKAINSRTVLLMAFLLYIAWLFTSLSDMGVAWTKSLPELVADLIYPCLFVSMFACLLIAGMMWLEENLDNNKHKLAM